jgi:hypothetical protein
MTITCHQCRYYILNEARCLLFYDGFIGIEKVKNGLIGVCKDAKTFERQVWE